MGFDLISHPMVRLFYYEVQTGVHDLQNQDLLQRLRIGFSKRYKYNPIYLTNFVILACPSEYKILNVMRIWKSFFRDVVFPDLSSAPADYGLRADDADGTCDTRKQPVQPHKQHPIAI
jgi:hypothetical protein